MPRGKILLALAFATAYLLNTPVVAADAPSDPPTVEHPSSDEVDQQAVVESYVKWFFKDSKSYKFEDAKQYVPKVVEAAREAGIDPLLAAVVISCESTWRPQATGKIGEVGLMQVHGNAAKGYDVTTVEGNLAAGCHWLASRVQKYGLEAGMAAYMGQSEEATKRAAWRVQAYRAEKKRQGLKD